MASNTKISIAVMGATGSGKSTFINLLSPTSNLEVSDLLESCTADVQTGADFIFGRHTVTLIDTPGFDDTDRSDADILKTIGDWLENDYKQGRKLNGVIYLHRISDNRMGGVSRRAFSLLRDLCGDSSLRNVMIATNMWGKVLVEEGEKREKQLQTDGRYFKPALDKGAKMARHYNTIDSARLILESIINNPPLKLCIQEELVDHTKYLGETTAAKTVFHGLVTWVKQLTEKIDSVGGEAQTSDDKKGYDEDISSMKKKRERAELQIKKLGPDAHKVWGRKTDEEKVTIMFRLSHGIEVNEPGLGLGIGGGTAKIVGGLQTVFDKYSMVPSLQSRLETDTPILANSKLYHDLQGWISANPKAMNKLEGIMKEAFGPSGPTKRLLFHWPHRSTH